MPWGEGAFSVKKKKKKVQEIQSWFISKVELIIV